MNRLWPLLLTLAGCTHADAADSIRLTVNGPMGMVAGDTVAYTVSWTAPVVVAGLTSAATSYTLTFSASATNGTWTVVADSNLPAGKWTSGSGTGPMPTNVNVTTLNVKSWLTAIPWDSATFTVSLIARNSAGSSSPAVVTWKVKHKIFPPGTPGNTTVDSSVTVVGLLVAPPTINLAVGSSAQLCAYYQMLSGHVAMRSQDALSCQTDYATRFSVFQRAVTPQEQVWADGRCQRWTSSNPSIAIVTTEPGCTGLGWLWMGVPTEVLRAT